MKKTIRFIFRKLNKIKIVFRKIFKVSSVYRLPEILSDEYLESNNSLSVVIFSKDRPMQLLGLLESLKEFSHPFIKPHIIYNAKNAEYEHAYQALFAANSNLIESFHNDSAKGFKQSLVDILESLNSHLITFFVDDILFKEKIDWEKVTKFNTKKIVPSLRMGTNLRRCYTANDSQMLPPLKKMGDYYAWFWSEGEHDWNYPLSVDGNIFSREEFLNMIKALSFKAPNTMELKLQLFKSQFTSRIGICFENNIIVNNPINIVQTEFFNLHGNIHQDQLLDWWNEGKRIDFMKYKGVKTISCHQEMQVLLRQD